MYRYLVFAVISILTTLFVGYMASNGALDAAPHAKVEPEVIEAAPRLRAVAREDSVTQIQRDETGQFFLTASVDGQDARFLVDTGADTVALTVSEAQDLGYDIRPENFEPLMKTASGTGYGQWVEIDTMDIGGQKFRNIPAVVIDGLGTNLLGQTVLGRLGRMELRGDTMILHHRTGG